MSSARGVVMRLVSALVLASAFLIAPCAHAAPDPAPTLATDARSGATTLTGAHHPSGAAFSLVVTDWWLSATIANAPAPAEVRLVVEVHLPTYPLLDRAINAAGGKLDLVLLNRGPSARWPKKASERVAVVLPGDYAEKARAAGLSVTVSGKDRSFPVAVPGDVLAHFLDSYAHAAGVAGAAPGPPARTIAVATAPAAQRTSARPVSPPAAAPPAAGPAPTPPAEAPAPDGDTEGGHGTWVDSLGLQFVATSSGAMVLTTRPGSIAAAKGIEGGDFIEKVDGVSIKTLDAGHMAARMGAPSVKVLHMIAAGDVKLR